MAFRNVLKISSVLAKRHIKRNYFIVRNFAEEPPVKRRLYPQECVNKTCKEEEPSFWSRLLRKKPKAKPPIQCCRVERAKCKPDPDLDMFGGEAFKTCGSAYLIQKNILPTEPCTISNEDKALQIIEAHLDCKNDTVDPMPQFTSVEQRMLDLNEKRLHPLYRRYQNISKRRNLALPENDFYKTRSGPIDPQEIPLQFKYNRQVLERKNMFVDYKRVDPPQQLSARIVEMKNNEQPTLEKRIELPVDSPLVSKRKNVFDTLHQEELKF